ncbi:hypothetical protein AVEN_260684-1 [Araneus ventricosus]|uniref:Uncharacterized protein n=1 Tax=Araneus ventricosus TaxID=182803 RepID=A0A4Y2N8L8_ARAVE|nr:hypothetical protein AVEN_260684-1 [Araneus ventricosus]
MTSLRKDIVHHSDELDVRAIDKGVKNCWSWNWLEKEIDCAYVREIIRKIDKLGSCKNLQYGKLGFAVLARRMKSAKHMSNVKAKKDNFALPDE